MTMSEDEDLARAIALSLQDSMLPHPSTSERRIVNGYEDGKVEVSDDAETEGGENEGDENGYNSYDEYVKYVGGVKHLESGESDEDQDEDEDEDEDEDDEDEDEDEDEEVADEYSDDDDPYEEVTDDFGGFDTYGKYIENLRRRHEYEDDVARAIAASKATARPTTSVTSFTFDSTSNQAIGPASAWHSTVATQSRSAVSDPLERYALVADRLERLKRLREDSEDLHRAELPLQKRLMLSRTTDCVPASRDCLRRKGKEVADNPEEADVFWDGELRQTANMHVEPRRNGGDGKPVFRLSQIIGDKSQIELAIISTYALQLSWINTFFSPSTPVVLVTQPAPSENGNATIKQVLPNWIRVTPFLRGGRGVMHMKFFLLFYKSGRLRIVISTANLMEHDWRDIENTVWVQDVPRRPSPIPHQPKADDFPSVLERVLCAINVAPAITNLVLTDHPNIPLTTLCAGALRTRWDFSRVRPMLVPSIAGRHEGWPAVLKSGHMALKRATSRLNPQQRAVSLEYQGSSIEAYSAEWLSEFVLSARGVSPEAALNAPKSHHAATPMPALGTLKILFPTLDCVRGSVLGEASGGTMFCRKSTWEAARFPRDLFCESRSRRGRVLMHSKMMIAVFVGASSSVAEEDLDSDADSDIVEVKMDQDDAVGYAYVGSHNFTPSAWGTLSRSGCTPVLNVTNYELGIVFPLKDEAEIDRVTCYERPAKRYGSEDRPWMQEVLNDRRDRNPCLGQHAAMRVDIFIRL